MFRVSKALQKVAQPMCRSLGTYKTSTGLVGLEVDPNGRQTLLDLASSIKEAVKVRFMDKHLFTTPVMLPSRHYSYLHPLLYLACCIYEVYNCL